MENIVVEKIIPSKTTENLSQMQLRSEVEATITNRSLNVFAPSLAGGLTNTRVAWANIDNENIEKFGIGEGSDLNEAMNKQGFKCRIREIFTTDEKNAYYIGQDGEMQIENADGQLRAHFKPNTLEYGTHEGKVVYVNRVLETVPMDEEFSPDVKLEITWVDNTVARKLTQLIVEKAIAEKEASRKSTVTEETRA